MNETAQQPGAAVPDDAKISVFLLDDHEIVRCRPDATYRRGVQGLVTVTAVPS